VYTAADKVTRIGSAQASGASNYYADAVIDEVRVSNVARSGDWIATEYNNQNSPGTFYTVGGQESGITTVPVTVTSAPAGLLLTVDGAGCGAPCSFQWTPGTSHTVAPTAGTQAGAAGVQYVFASWSDGGAQSHLLTAPGAAATYTANFTTQYFLTTAVNPAGGGSITPASGWMNSGSVVTVSASAGGGYSFTGFTGALSGTTTPQNLTMTGPLTVTATFGTGSAPGWYNTSWSNRKAVTVYHGQVAGAASLTSFPMLFAVTDPNLKTVANGGSVGKADGSDILFTAADGVTKLDHEMQQYDGAAGQVVAWVRIPSLSPTADTVVYVYYGNAGAAEQQNKAGVWSNGYKGVWHLADNAASAAVADSSGNGFTGTNQANTNAKTTAGKMGAALAYNGSTDFTSVASSAGLGSGLSGFTISAWVKKNSNNTVDALVWHGDDNDGSGASYRILTLSSGQIQYNAGNWNTGKTFNGSTIADTTNWHYIVATYDGTTLRGYYEGAADGSSSAGVYTAGDKVTRIGAGQASGANTYYASAVLEEVRIANVSRTAEWVLTEYRNQNAPSAFYGVGPQENVGEADRGRCR